MDHPVYGSSWTPVGGNLYTERGKSEGIPMAVLPFSGNAGDHAIGLVAVSSWQGWLTHQPRSTGNEQPGYGASNLSRLYSTFTWSSPKSAFGYVKNGHTALCAREAGTLSHVVGFNPNSFFLAGVLQTLMGNNITVQG